MGRLIGLMVLTISLLLVALLVQLGPLPTDLWLTEWLSSSDGRVWSVISRLASVPVWTGLVVALAVLLSWRGLPRSALLLVAADLSAEIITLGLKGLVNRPRPGVAAVEDMVATGSFPSSHVVRVTVTLGVLLLAVVWPHPSWRLATLLGVTVCLLLVGVARIASGEHWASDVLGGYLLGSVWLVIVILLPAIRGLRPP